MPFRENLLSKIEIDRLSAKVIRSIDPTDGTKRIDRQTMFHLLEKGSFDSRRERDLDLYFLDSGPDDVPTILVLDNELAVYHTTVDDVVLRKSPTIKEMVNIRNAIKILKDSDVLVSKKVETVRLVQKRCIDGLDLTYTKADVEKIEAEALSSLDSGYADGILEGLTLFGELLGYGNAPKPFRMRHCQILGPSEGGTDTNQFGPPVIVFRKVDNHLMLIDRQLTPQNRADREYLTGLVEKSEKRKKDGIETFQYLTRAVVQALS